MKAASCCCLGSVVFVRSWLGRLGRGRLGAKARDALMALHATRLATGVKGPYLAAPSPLPSPQQTLFSSVPLPRSRLNTSPTRYPDLQQPSAPRHCLNRPTSINMSVVSLLGVEVKNNPATFDAPYEFEITFECLEQLQKGEYTDCCRIAAR